MKATEQNKTTRRKFGNLLLCFLVWSDFVVLTFHFDSVDTSRQLLIPLALFAVRLSSEGSVSNYDVKLWKRKRN